jgi:hypothetical protein
MSVIEIEREIKPLSQQEKEELFKFLAEELHKEDLLKYFKPGATYPVFTPLGMEEGAAKLQEYLDRGDL